jgi:hypothetical protein
MLSSYLSGEYKDNLFSSNRKAASFKRDNLIPSSVIVKINLLEIGDFSERFRKFFSPQYSATVTAAILKENN